MERSFATRLIGRPFGLSSPAPRRSRPARRSHGSGLGAVEQVRSLLPTLWAARGARIALICVAIALPVLGGGFLLVRHSSFVAVQRVRVSGVHGAEASAIEAALVSAAHHMSTLDVQTGGLMAAVAQFRVVSSIRAVASFPHGLRIEVREQPPVAALVVNGQRTAVAANGLVLGPALLSSSLPTLSGYFEPAAGQSLHDVTLLESVSVLGAAPRSLARHVTKVYSGPQGLTVAMGNGLLVYFGDATRPHAKWLSLARVLADHSSAGAIYVDVRLPSRPAAGFPAGAAPSSASGEEPTPGSESAVGALAEGLTKESGANTSAPAASSSTPTASSEPSSSSGEASKETQTGTAQTGEAEARTPKEASTQEAQTPSG